MDAWAILLAGGDGRRLQSLTRRISGDARPKQFCPLIEGDTLLARTQRRVALAVRPDRHVVVVTQHHAAYYADLADTLLPGRLVVQPENRGTAAAIVYALLTVRQLAGDAPVVVCPSDHDVAEERALAACVSRAIGAVAASPDAIVLLGIEPTAPEAEYGWIEPAAWPLAGEDALFPVMRFWEKPTLQLAQQLYRRGCLWNSFIMAGRTTAFLALVQASAPRLWRVFAPLSRAAGTAREAQVAGRVYAGLADVGFSDAVLARMATRLLVLRATGIGWTDLGSPERVAAALGRVEGWPAGLDVPGLASTA
jgi:mannose-1-phosphate guanylyltransferase